MVQITQVIEYRKATRQYRKQGDRMIDLEPGDIIEVYQNTPNGWSRGNNYTGDEVGWFPISLTVVISKDEFMTEKQLIDEEDYYEDEEEFEEESENNQQQQDDKQKQQQNNEQEQKSNEPPQIVFRLTDEEASKMLEEQKQMLEEKIRDLSSNLADVQQEQTQLKNEIARLQLIEQKEKEQQKIIEEYEQSRTELINSYNEIIKQKEQEIKDIEQEVVQQQESGFDVELQREIQALQLENLNLKRQMLKNVDDDTMNKVRQRFMCKHRQTIVFDINKLTDEQ